MANYVIHMSKMYVSSEKNLFYTFFRIIMSMTIYDVDTAVIQIVHSVNHSYTRDELLNMKITSNTLPDLEEKVIRTHRDIAHMILPNFEPNQIVETVDKSDKEKLDWDDYEEIVEIKYQISKS